MKNYKTDYGATNWPWIESPFFNDLINHQDLTDEEKILAKQFNEYGYILLDLELSDDEINEIRNEIDRLNNMSDTKTQENGYHYSKGKRIFEGWRDSEILRSLALHPKIINLLNKFYKRNPYPFQTITFNYGSNQPLHSDLIHFDSLPHRWLTAAWVALEDMTENNGSLIYVPKSHKLPIFDFYDLKIKVPEYGKQFDSYQEYENFIQQLVSTNQLPVESLICKKGQVLIWAANLIHGGDVIRDPNSTRYSQVTHYYYDDCDVYYSPMFSDAWKGDFKHKNIKEKNIRNY